LYGTQERGGHLAYDDQTSGSLHHFSAAMGFVSSMMLQPMLQAAIRNTIFYYRRSTADHDEIKRDFSNEEGTTQETLF
jgi:hypothetical protein